MFKQISCVCYITITFHLGYVYIMETSKITGSSLGFTFTLFSTSQYSSSSYLITAMHLNVFCFCFYHKIDFFHIAVMRTRKLSFQDCVVFFFYK